MSYAAEIKVPELRSCYLHAREGGEGSKLTKLVVARYYHTFLRKEFDLRTDANPVRARLNDMGVVHFGPLYHADGQVKGRGSIVKDLEAAGLVPEHLVFLNTMQLTAIHIYMQSLGLVRR